MHKFNADKSLARYRCKQKQKLWTILDHIENNCKLTVGSKVPNLALESNLPCSNALLFLFTDHLASRPSSETQGQIVGARESLRERKNMARRKEKNGE